MRLHHPDGSGAADAMVRSWVRAPRAERDLDLAAEIDQWLREAGPTDPSALGRVDPTTLGQHDRAASAYGRPWSHLTRAAQHAGSGNAPTR